MCSYLLAFRLYSYLSSRGYVAPESRRKYGYSSPCFLDSSPFALFQISRVETHVTCQVHRTWDLSTKCKGHWTTLPHYMVFLVHKWLVCCLPFIPESGQLLQYIFQPLKTQTSRRRRKGRRAKMTPRPRSCPIQSKFSSSSRWKLVRDSLTMEWTVRTLKTIWGHLMRLIFQRFWQSTWFICLRGSTHERLVEWRYFHSKVHSSLESRGCQLHHLPRLQVRLLRLIAHRSGLGGLFRREIQARVYCGQGVGHLTILSRTILYIGIMYAIGQSVLALGAVGNGPEVRLTILPPQNIFYLNTNK